MKIAHVTWSMDIGGVETMLVDIVNEQIKKCEVCVYVINDLYNKDLLDNLDSRVKLVLCHRKQGSKNILQLIKFNLSLFFDNPDIIHCHQSNLAPIIWYPSNKVLTIHNTYTSPKYLGKYQQLFCISKAVKYHITNLGFHNGIVIYNGIHTSQILEKKYYSNNMKRGLRLVCVGRLHPDKGQSLIIEALRELRDKYQLMNISCDLIGDGPECEKLESLTTKYELTNKVNFLGVKSRIWIYSHLKDYDVYVMPSLNEGFGLTLAEACAAKLPVLVSDIDGPLEIINGGKLGMVFKHGDADDLADKLFQFIRDGYDTSVVEKAYQNTLEHYDIVMTAQRYIEEYKKEISN